jgi:hypothetical protein
MPRSLVVLLSVIAVILIAGAGLFVVAAPNVVPDSVRFWKDDEYVYTS